MNPKTFRPPIAQSKKQQKKTQLSKTFFLVPVLLPLVLTERSLERGRPHIQGALRCRRWPFQDARRRNSVARTDMRSDKPLRQTTLRPVPRHRNCCVSLAASSRILTRTDPTTDATGTWKITGDATCRKKTRISCRG